MAVARVYVGAHWPLDVVAGLAVGAGISILLMLVLRPPVAGLVRRMRSRACTPCSPPLRPDVSGFLLGSRG